MVHMQKKAANTVPRRASRASLPRHRRHAVAVLVGHGLSAFEFAVACEVFGVDRTKDFGVPWYRFAVCSADPSPIKVANGFTLNAPYGLEGVRRADTVIVPAAAEGGRPSPEVLEALQGAHRRGARLVSVCTGAFTLAEAGLLDGRRATTHWRHTEELARRFPEVQVDPDVLYVDDGDILTSAGTAAGIDLCLHIVRLDYGAEIANMLARRMVVPPHRDGGQAQFVQEPVPAEGVLADPFADTLIWVQEHLDEPVSVAQLASRSAMSGRTFARRFRAAHGTTPHQWLLRQRVIFAQRLLETSDLPVEVVASRCGLGTATNLRQHFQRIVRTSPNAYRRAFQQDRQDLQERVS
jgi:AraC family transcriptional activator FtrA